VVVVVVAAAAARLIQIKGQASGGSAMRRAPPAGLMNSWHPAIRELLKRGYGRPRQSMEVSVPAGDPLQLLLDEIDARSRIDPPVSHDPNRDHLPPGFNRAD
jgi:hypothetical protein